MPLISYGLLRYVLRTRSLVDLKQSHRAYLCRMGHIVAALKVCNVSCRHAAMSQHPITTWKKEASQKTLLANQSFDIGGVSEHTALWSSCSRPPILM